MLFQYAYSVHFLVDSEGRGCGGSVSGDTDTQKEQCITKDGNVEVLANVFLKLVGQDFVADREEIVHVNGNNQSILPLFDGFLNSEQMRLAWNLRESELFHNGSEFGVPRSSSLLETVECLFKAKDLAFGNIHSLGSFHVDLLIEIPIKVSVLDVDLTYLPVLFNGKHEHQPQGFKASNRGECILVVHTIGLAETTRNKSGFIANNLASFVEFHAVNPFA